MSRLAVSYSWPFLFSPFQNASAAVTQHYRRSRVFIDLVIRRHLQAGLQLTSLKVHSGPFVARFPEPAFTRNTITNGAVRSSSLPIGGRVLQRHDTASQVDRGGSANDTC